jgi:hypothetical protein
MIPNTLWQKAGGTPAPLPASDRDATGTPWDNLAGNAAGRAACGYTKAPDWPDFDPATQVPGWVNGAWVVGAIPTPTPAVRTVSHYEFSNLLTNDEKVRINAAKAQIAAMTAANYGDVAFSGLIAVQLVFDAFALASFIELTASATIYGVGTILRAAGIFTTDARAAAVLAGTPPA